MRRIWIFLLIIAALLPCAAVAQTSDLDIDMDAGRISYQSRASATLSSALPLKDGTLLLVLREGDAVPDGPVAPDSDIPFPEVARKVTLLRIADDGSLLWTQTFGEAEGSVGLLPLCEAADGSVLALADHSVEQKLQYRQLRRFSMQDGSLIWSGDKQAAQEDTGERAYPVGDGYLWETIHDRGRSTTPRYYALHAADGTQRWQVDDTRTVPVLHTALTAPQGTLLMGNAWSDVAKDYNFCAALVDATGNVVWRKVYAELGASTFMCGAVSPTGQLAAVALVGSIDGPRQDVLVTLDAATGDLRAGDSWPAKDILPPTMIASGDGWLICAARRDDGKQPGFRFYTADANGKVTKEGDTSFAADYVLGPRLLTWSGALWMDYELRRPDAQICQLQRIQP